MIIVIPFGLVGSPDISAEQVLLHGKFIEPRIDMCVWFQEIDDLLGCDALLKGWLQGRAGQSRYHEVREGVLNSHQVLQKRQVDLGTSVGIDFEVGLHYDEFVVDILIFDHTSI